MPQRTHSMSFPSMLVVFLSLGVACAKDERRPAVRETHSASRPVASMVPQLAPASSQAAVSPSGTGPVGSAGPAAKTSSAPGRSAGVPASARTAGEKAERLTVRRAGQAVAAAKARAVLHVGDSMVPLVGNYLRPRFEQQGGKYEIISISSSTTLSWAEQAELKRALTEHDPELVLISLGSNELFFKDDLDERARAVRGIVEAVGGRSCLWIGPPSWAKVRGFLDVLEANLGPCRYFDSARIKMSRQEDGRHPTWAASAHWANLVWERLGGER